ncbi:hypothetical protein ACFL9T_16690 [Thermodesulfobacteriota bacterium]
MEEQAAKVKSFYTFGELTFKKWYGGSEFRILIAGTKDPYRLRIEISHSWGQPVIFIQIIKSRLEVLSFQEKKVYIGLFTPESMSRFLPGKLDHRLIWGVLRGFPILLEHQLVLSSRPDRISLLDKAGKEVEVIDFDSESLLPRLVEYPRQATKLVFSEFHQDGGIYYAGKIKTEKIKGLGEMTLKRKRAVFNRSIQEQLFQLEKPPGFEVHSLDQ